MITVMRVPTFVEVVMMVTLVLAMVVIVAKMIVMMGVGGTFATMVPPREFTRKWSGAPVDFATRWVVVPLPCVTQVSSHLP